MSETKKLKTQKVETPKKTNESSSLGTATRIVAIIFCVLESILAICLIILYGILPFFAKQDSSTTQDQKNGLKCQKCHLTCQNYRF